MIEELYRKEYGKMVTVLCSRFGMAFMETAEDIVSEAFLSAAETWGQKGVPPNPAAWLYTVARNSALNRLKHERIFKRKIKGDLSRDSMEVFAADIDLSPRNITDSQLRMIFAICHPSIPAEAQISLALRVLCGFSVDEIAAALLTTRANVNKRLFRAKDRIRTGKIALAVPDAVDLGSRLDTVLVTLYLLFNEGYYSAGPDKVLRKDLCLEAMRLVNLLIDYPPTSLPRVYALIALMCFQASRFEARVGPDGELVLYEDQDSSLWDAALIEQGNYCWMQAFSTEVVSRYHLEASIAWWHTHQADTGEKWANILRLYNQLLMLAYSPMAALNRAYAFYKVYGKEKAIVEAESLELEGNLFYHSLLAELFTGVDRSKAIAHLDRALELTTVKAEREVLRRKRQMLTS